MSLEKCKSPVNVSLIFQSLNNERDTTIAQDAVLPPQDVFGQSRTIRISESSTTHSGQPPGLKTYEKEPLNMDMSGSDHTVPVD